MAGSLKNEISGKPWVLVVFILLAAISGLFLQTLGFEFLNWDDGAFVTNNPYIKKINSENLLSLFTSVERFPVWNPITWLSHALDYKLYGLAPWGHHLTNVIVHFLNALCLMIMLVQIVRLIQPEHGANTVWAGLCVALLFSMHPLRVESVAWVSERKDLLSTFFSMLTVITYIHYVTHAPRRQFYYRLALFFFLLAAMSKPSVLTLPLVLLILDFYPLGRGGMPVRAPAVYLEKIPFLLLSGFAGVMSILGHSIRGALTVHPDLDVHGRIVTALRGLYFLVYKTVFPFDLVPLYPLSLELSFLSLPVLTAFATLAGMTGLSVYLWWRGKKALWVVWLSFLVSAIPVSGLLHPAGILTADRYSYFTTLGFYILAGVGISGLLNRYGRYRTLLGVSCIILILGALTHRQLQVWRNSQVFWETVTAKYATPLTSNNLGNVYFAKGWLDRAEEQFNRALQLDPGYPEALFNLGGLYLLRGENSKSEEVLKAGFLLQNYSPKAHNSMGVLYAKQGYAEKAENEFRFALDLNPDDSMTHLNLGILYGDSGRIGESIAELERAYTLNPDNEQALAILIDTYKLK